jgi:hypothetical protein
MSRKRCARRFSRLVLLVNSHVVETGELEREEAPMIELVVLAMMVLLEAIIEVLLPSKNLMLIEDVFKMTEDTV